MTAPKVVLKGIQGTNCNSPGHCSRHHYWAGGSKAYQGELCCWPTWVNGVEKLQPCPNLSNPTEYQIDLTVPPTPSEDPTYVQGHRYAGPSRYSPQGGRAWDGDNDFRREG